MLDVCQTQKLYLTVAIYIWQTAVRQGNFISNNNSPQTKMYLFLIHAKSITTLAKNMQSAL